ncbi:MAG: hypothetical protein EB033_08650 [Proteobacteria bacterium]|nr:hypothetical protein [Pseudomonadota bacterium]
MRKVGWSSDRRSCVRDVHANVARPGIDTRLDRKVLPVTWTQGRRGIHDHVDFGEAFRGQDADVIGHHTGPGIARAEQGTERCPVRGLVMELGDLSIRLSQEKEHPGRDVRLGNFGGHDDNSVGAAVNPVSRGSCAHHHARLLIPTTPPPMDYLHLATARRCHPETP